MLVLEVAAVARGGGWPRPNSSPAGLTLTAGPLPHRDLQQVHHNAGIGKGLIAEVSGSNMTKAPAVMNFLAVYSLSLQVNVNQVTNAPTSTFALHQTITFLSHTKANNEDDCLQGV
jgi:hypothetical protein